MLEYSKNGDYISFYKPQHWNTQSNGRVLEHRYNYEKHYNCCLLTFVDIHHKNNIKNDNRIENLQPMYKHFHGKIVKPRYTPETSPALFWMRKGREEAYRLENGLINYEFI